VPPSSEKINIARPVVCSFMVSLIRYIKCVYVIWKYKGRRAMLSTVPRLYHLYFSIPSGSERNIGTVDTPASPI
jgi:hypothetical protein